MKKKTINLPALLSVMLLAFSLAACAGGSSGGGGGGGGGTPSVEQDSDGDGIADARDNCPRIPNPDQANRYGDLSNRSGTGDACEDSDNDGEFDAEDNCPTVSNRDQANRYGDLSNRSGTGDACEDSDNDGEFDAEDNCPTVSNADQDNLDGDTAGDVCDPDIDGDGRNNEADAFPRNRSEQADTDNDTIGDNADNCPMVKNRDQANNYGPEGDEGDVCDDTDGDGTTDQLDSCPPISDPQCIAITSAANLTAIPDNAPGSYLLRTHLILNATNNNRFPINNFTGLFNGGDHTILGLASPLFNDIGTGAQVTQIGILNSTLANTNNGNISFAYTTGNSDSIYRTHGIDDAQGGLVDFNNGVIDHSYATGNSRTELRATGDATIFNGGLVGLNNGLIRDSYANGTIFTAGGSGIEHGGGLVGRNDGNIIRSYATGNSDSAALNYMTGGLIGLNNGNISYSYATGNSRGRGANVGGLVGRNAGLISRSYATGNTSCIDGNCHAGGLVGRNQGGILRDCYATGDSYVAGPSDPGSFAPQSYSAGLVGTNVGTIRNCYAAGLSSGGVRFTTGGLVGQVAGTIMTSYRVQSTGTTGGTVRTLGQLQCPTSPGDSSCTPTAYDGWNATIWDFGTTTELPTLFDLPACPTFRPNCRH